MLSHAKGFAIFTIIKAGFLFSARAGSGVVIAKLDDGCERLFDMFSRIYWLDSWATSTAWSAPSAIGTAGLGVGGQAGAEVADFMVVLNSRSVCAYTSVRTNDLFMNQYTV